MKLLTPILFTLTFVLIFTQCKKNNPPQPQGHDISHGYYIIRTKYMCPEGKAFVLGSFSNREFIAWQPVSPEELKSIREDGPHESNPFIWKIGESVSHGGTVSGTAPVGAIGGISYFSIYQDDLSDPSKPYRWYLTTPSGTSSTDDQTGLGIGPSSFATQSTFTDEDLQHMTIRATYFSVTDSTGRIATYGGPDWWFVSLPTDPDDICDGYNDKVIWRNSWVCPNTTVIGNAWKSDACAISQLVLEKID